MTRVHLREDLQLFPQQADAQGHAAALVYDPVRHAYFRLSAQAMQIVLRLGGAPAPGRTEREGVEAVANFLRGNQLTAGADAQALAAAARQRRASPLRRAIHNYLFFRIPLLHPHRALARLQPAAGFLFARAFWTVQICLACAGLYLVSREWDRFAADVMTQLQWSGLPLILLVVALLKTMHEAGHAVTAARYGCRVAAMGVAFLALAPTLYTDTTDAWRVPQRRRRILITSAGVLAEMIAAVLALCMWPFLPEGAWRHMAVTAAVVAPLTTLAINLNPCMRFDGYFILADLLEVENLQARAFALARWKLRETLFAPGDACPENMDRRKILILIAYAWTTWIYRLILFTGIALFVYAFFIKLVGVVLFAIEMLWFVVLPVWRELRVWRMRRKRFTSTARSKVTIALTLACLVLLFVPWSASVRLPAMLMHSEEQALHAASAARIASLRALANGVSVTRGDVLLELESPDLAFEIAKTGTDIRTLRLRMARIAADGLEREQLPVLRESLRAREEKLAGLQRMSADLALRAPMSGVVRDVEPDLHPGRWIRPSLRIAILTGGSSLAVRALAGEAEAARLAAGDTARFVPDDGARMSSAFVVTDVDRVNEPYLSLEALAFHNGGAIAATREPSGKLRPLSPVYAVRLVQQGPVGDARAQAAGIQALRGVVVIDGVPESVATKIWRRIVRVAIRESGF